MPKPSSAVRRCRSHLSGRPGLVVAAGGALVAGLLVAPLAVTPAAAVEPAATDRTVEFSTGGLQPLQPARLLDTRPTGRTADGLSQAGGAVAAGTARTLQVAGRGGVPVVGAGAVWLNVTVTGSSAPGHLTVHPSGTQRPNASNLNFAKGQTAPNLVLAKLGTAGRVELAAAATTHVLADVVGWVPEGRDVQALQPARVLDTRATGRTIDAQHQATAAFAAGQTRSLPLAGRAGVPAVGVGAVVVNLTAIGPTKAGHLTAWPSGTARPNASSLNFAAGTITPNLVVAKLGADGAISIHNVGGSTSVLADVVGWMPAESAYGALTPARILDTRSSGTTADGLHQATGAISAGETRRLPVTGRGGVPSTGVGAVVVNLTGTGPTAGTHLTVFPSGTALPNASSLNLTRGATRANLVVAKVGVDGAISIANAAAATHAVADVVGWFPSGTAASATPSPSPAGTGSVKMVLPATTELAGAGDVLTVEGTADRPTSIMLAAGADIPPVGGHLVAMPSATLPDGTLVRVSAIAQNGDGSTTLAVERAAVPDAFVDLEISFKGPLVLQDRGLPTGAEAGLRRGNMLLQREPTRDFGFGPVSKAGFTCSGSATATMSFDASFQSSSAEVTFDLSERHLRFLATTTPTVTAGASLEGSATCTREISLPGKLPLGPTGLFLAADLALDVTTTGHISASASVGAPVTMGFEYRAGAVSNLSTASYTGSAGIAKEETQASLTITPSVELDLEFLGAVEIELMLATPVTGTVIPLGTPCATLDVGGSVGAEAELELPWLPDIEAEIGQFDLGSATVWQGECEDKAEQVVPGTWTGTISLSNDQATLWSSGTRTSQSGGSMSIRNEKAYAGSQTFALENAPSAYSQNLFVGDQGLKSPPSVSVGTYRSAFSSQENDISCSYSDDGLTPDPSLSSLQLWMAAPDDREIHQVAPGETVLVAFDAVYQGDTVASFAGSDTCFRGAYGSYGPVHGFIDTPDIAPEGEFRGRFWGEVDSCPAGTTPGFQQGGGTPSKCGFPVVLGPDRSIELDRTITFEQLNWLKEPGDEGPSTGTVTLNVKASLLFNP